MPFFFHPLVRKVEVNKNKAHLLTWFNITYIFWCIIQTIAMKPKIFLSVQFSKRASICNWINCHHIAKWIQNNVPTSREFHSNRFMQIKNFYLLPQPNKKRASYKCQKYFCNIIASPFTIKRCLSGILILYYFSVLQ